VTGAPQHAAVFCAKWKYVTWLVQIFRRRFRVGDSQYCCCAIIGAYSCGHAPRRVHRDSEIGVMFFPVLRHHTLQAELVGALIRNGDTNQAPAMRRHKIHRFRRHFFRRHDQIAFVLAIRVVGHDHHAPFRNVA
jgi:hypothetical protein